MLGVKIFDKTYDNSSGMKKRCKTSPTGDFHAPRAALTSLPSFSGSPKTYGNYWQPSDCIERRNGLSTPQYWLEPSHCETVNTRNVLKDAGIWHSSSLRWAITNYECKIFADPGHFMEVKEIYDR